MHVPPRLAVAAPPAAVRRWTSGRALALLLGVAVVSTAGAPGIVRLQRGDTLSEIAHRYGSTVAALRSVNGLSSDRIYAGQDLRVPGTAGRSTGERIHRVRAGDNVWALADRYGTSPRRILLRNALPRDGQILPGQELAIPGTAGSAPSPVRAVPGVPRRVAASVARHRELLAARPAPSRSGVRRLVAATARRHGVDPALALAVAAQESGFSQRAVSPTDALGVMQVLPSTGRALGRQVGRPFDLLSTRDNVTAGVLLLRQLRAGTKSDAAALAGYYQGLGSIAEQGLRPETRAYQRSVTALRERFRSG